MKAKNRQTPAHTSRRTSGLAGPDFFGAARRRGAGFLAELFAV